MKILKRAAVFVLVLCMLSSMINVMAADKLLTLTVSGKEDYSASYDVLDRLNKLRSDMNLPALTMDKGLLSDAMLRAAECAVYFDHTRPDGRNCFTAFSASGSLAENIAAGQRTAEAVMNSWINSPGHYGNMVNASYVSVGIGCFYQNGSRFWVQCFSSGKATPQPAISGTKNVTAKISVNTDYLSPVLNKTDLTDGSSQLRLVNRNTEFFSEGLYIDSDNLTFTSSSPEIVSVTPEGIMKRHNCAGAVISCYADGVLLASLDLPAASHSYKAETTPPTCTEAGSVTYTCTVCGDTYTEPGAPAAGHSFGNWTDNGNDHIRRCLNCDVTETAAHNYSVTRTAPTCVIPGSTVSVCKDCGKTVRESIPAAGHSYKSTVTPPTCTSAGTVTYKCSVCGDTYTEPGAPAAGHSYKSTVTPPTCTSAGTVTYKCSVCGDTYTEPGAPAAGHDYQATVIPPTEASGGYTVYTCSRCGDSYTGDFTDPLPPVVQIIPGDANGDGDVGNADLIMVARHVVHIVTLTGKHFEAGDMDRSGDITNTDVIRLARVIVGIE
ncbi:MAG: hypothetical protein IJL71_05235 [Oscillospiraceae bacterium]|nr:hypothetical protein [Oscillospiraceae bacterium]